MRKENLRERDRCPLGAGAILRTGHIPASYSPLNERGRKNRPSHGTYTPSCSPLNGRGRKKCSGIECGTAQNKSCAVFSIPFLISPVPYCRGPERLSFLRPFKGLPERVYDPLLTLSLQEGGGSLREDCSWRGIDPGRNLLFRD